MDVLSTKINRGLDKALGAEQRATQVHLKGVGWGAHQNEITFFTVYHFVHT